MNKKFGIQLDNGQYKVCEGKNIMEAFATLNIKTDKGNLNFALMNFYFSLPIPIQEEGKLYQLFLMKDKKSNWENFGKPTSNFNGLDLLLQTKVKREGIYSAIIVDMETEKPIVWLWGK